MRPGFRIRSHIPPKRIYRCVHCGLHHTVKPQQCIKCGWLEFDHFPSEAEAIRWAQLLLLVKLGKVTDLQKQVRFDLLAYGPGGVPVKVGVYVADFVYRRDGVRVIEDVKGRRKASFVADPVAKLKLEWMAAMGNPVTIVKL